MVPRVVYVGLWLVHLGSEMLWSGVVNVVVRRRCSPRAPALCLAWLGRAIRLRRAMLSSEWSGLVWAAVLQGGCTRSASRSVAVSLCYCLWVCRSPVGSVWVEWLSLMIRQQPLCCADERMWMWTVGMFWRDGGIVVCTPEAVCGGRIWGGSVDFV